MILNSYKPCSNWSVKWLLIVNWYGIWPNECRSAWNISACQSQQPTQAVFLLDIALNSDINGIQLASQIRDLGIRSKIIFVTTHTELSLTVFQYQVEALDFILKDFPDRLYERLNTVLRVAQERFKAEDNDQNSYIQIKIGETIRSLDATRVIFWKFNEST